MKKVLIVDDQDMIRKLINMTLDDGTFDCIEAMNGEHAIGTLKQVKPDLVILDIMMPGDINGIGVCTRIKNTDVWQDIPVLMLSAKSQKIDIEEGLNAGADAYLLKPFSPETLLDKVNELLSGQAN